MSDSDQEVSELALDSAGVRLRRAREAAGLSLADIASRTRIAERHLRSIEAGKFMALASRAYAVGFSRNYAREVGLDEDEIAHAVRAEADGQEPLTARYQPSSFEPGDPARIPAARIAWISALSALAVVVAGFIFWRSLYAPAASLPDIAPEASASANPGDAAGGVRQDEGVPAVLVEELGEQGRVGHHRREPAVVQGVGHRLGVGQADGVRAGQQG